MGCFIQEVEAFMKDPMVTQYLNVQELKQALSEIKVAKPEYVYQFGFRILMRGLIFSRFIKNLHERGEYMQNLTKKEWATPTLEVLDVKMTMAGPGMHLPDAVQPDPTEVVHYS